MKLILFFIITGAAVWAFKVFTTARRRHKRRMLLSTLHIPDDPGHTFHMISASDSISFRPVNPGQSGHKIRRIATHRTKW